MKISKPLIIMVGDNKSRPKQVHGVQWEVSNINDINIKMKLLLKWQKVKKLFLLIFMDSQKHTYE